jgi:hypothetical protein
VIRCFCPGCLITHRSRRGSAPGTIPHTATPPLERHITKPLPIIFAALEAATALALLAAPSLVASLLLGVPLDTPVGLAVARVAGASLLALALACGLTPTSPRVHIAAMLLYNLAVIAVLLFARLGQGLSGIGLWPAIVLHTALAAWCIASLFAAANTPRSPSV